jgi:hypothetical protein
MMVSQLKLAMIIMLLLCFLYVCSAVTLFDIPWSKHGLIWGTIPSKSASIRNSGTWQTLKNATILFNITSSHNEGSVISYDIGVKGLWGNFEKRQLPREGRYDTLQLRCLVDNVPLRTSSSYTLTYGTGDIVFAHLVSSFIVNLDSYAIHNITLQWKKTGSLVNEWIISDSDTSLSSAFSVAVQMDHKKSYYISEFNDVYITTENTWKSLSDVLSFNLVVEENVTIGYSFTANPYIKTFILDNKMEYISSRILIDGIPHTEFSETFGCNAWQPRAVVLNSQSTLTMKAGTHSVQLQWKKNRNFFQCLGIQSHFSRWI